MFSLTVIPIIMSENTTGAGIERTQPTSLGGSVIVIISIVLSTISYGPLADTIRIRWTIGTYQHYGPESVTTLPVLVAFPVLVAGLYIGARWLKTYLECNDSIGDSVEFNAIYDICMLLTIGTVVVSQIIIIVLNLWSQ